MYWFVPVYIGLTRFIPSSLGPIQFSYTANTMRSTKSRAIKQEAAKIPPMLGSIKNALQVTPVIMESIRPSIPVGQTKKKKLEDNLTVMRCENLLRLPWNY